MAGGKGKGVGILRGVTWGVVGLKLPLGRTGVQVRGVGGRLG